MAGDAVPEAPQPAGAAGAPLRERQASRAALLGRAAAFARTHWLFFLFLAVGFALRTVVFLAYQPALFSPDSRHYLDQSTDLEPSPLSPIGYPLFLRLLPLSQGLALIPLLQHLFGLALAALLYALLLRLGVRRWLAALATAPVLLDAYQLNVEEYALAESLFDLLVVGAAAALLWRRPLGPRAAALAGLLLAAAALTRVITVLAVAPALLAILFLGAGRPLRERLAPVAAFLGVVTVTLGGYALWYHSIYGSYALAGSTGRHIYGRVAPWVDCGELSVPDYERVLCPAEPPGRRPQVYELMWTKASPIARVELPPGKTRTAVASNFARRAIRQQPAGYARAVGADFLTSFAPTKESRSGGHRVAQWEFQTSFPIPGYPPSWSTSPPRSADEGDVRRPLAEFLRTYQQVGYVPGPLLGLGLLAGLATALGIGRSARSGLRTAAFVFCGLDLALCLGTLLIVPFSWRYQLPQLFLLTPAAAVAVTAFSRREPFQPH
jgi:hypothetical protein